MSQPLSAILGLDIGRVNTRASLFTIENGRYRFQAGSIAPTSLGEPHISRGVVEAVRHLQQETNSILLKPSGSPYVVNQDIRMSVDRIALTSSAGRAVRTVLLGLSELGSLASGRRLASSLPLDLVGAFGLADLGDESNVVGRLIQLQPELLILTGGEDGGAEKSMERWVELVRLMCKVTPSAVKPTIVYSGNPKCEELIHRRVEPVARLVISPNIQPVYGKRDFVPAQRGIDREILRFWQGLQPDFKDLLAMADNLVGTKSFAIGRMVRYLSRVKNEDATPTSKSGVLAVDVGGGSTVVSAGLNGKMNTVMLLQREELSAAFTDRDLFEIHQWTSEPSSKQEVHQFLSNAGLQPGRVPETQYELAITQARARVRLKRALQELSLNSPWFAYDPDKGMTGHFEPIVASGAVLTQAPNPAQALLILLDSLQPWGISTFVLDKHHLLPILGLIGQIEPVLPVHVLNSDAFSNLGCVVTAVSDIPEGESVITVGVKPETGKSYAVDVLKGTLRRLVIPPGQSVILDLDPKPQTDVGFGRRGQGGRIRVISGAVGVVIDARGRPLKLVEDDEERIAQLNRWMWSVGN